MIVPINVMRAKLQLQEIICVLGHGATSKRLGYTLDSLVAWGDGKRCIGEYACKDVPKLAKEVVGIEVLQGIEEWMKENPRLVQNNYAKKFRLLKENV